MHRPKNYYANQGLTATRLLAYRDIVSSLLTTLQAYRKREITKSFALQQLAFYFSRASMLEEVLAADFQANPRATTSYRFFKRKGKHTEYATDLSMHDFFRYQQEVARDARMWRDRIAA